MFKSDLNFGGVFYGPPGTFDVSTTNVEIENYVIGLLVCESS